MGALSLAFFKVHPPDAEAMELRLRQEGKWGAPGSDERKAAMLKIRKGARHFVPKGDELADQLQGMFDRYKDCVSAVTRQQLFTPDTYKAHAAQIALAKEDAFSGLHCLI